MPLTHLNAHPSPTLLPASFLLPTTHPYLVLPFLHPRSSCHPLPRLSTSTTILQPICSVYWLHFLLRSHLPTMQSQVLTLSQLYPIKILQKIHLAPLYGAPSHLPPAHPSQILPPPSHSMQETFQLSHLNPTSYEYSNTVQQQMKYS